MVPLKKEKACPRFTSMLFINTLFYIASGCRLYDLGYEHYPLRLIDQTHTKYKVEILMEVK